jgi:hypothetical protein
MAARVPASVAGRRSIPVSSRFVVPNPVVVATRRESSPTTDNFAFIESCRREKSQRCLLRYAVEVGAA